MNAVAPPADQFAPHMFTVEELYGLFRAGVLLESCNVELISGSVRSRGDGALHRFTVDDMLAMVQAGILEEGGRTELIEGVLIDMPADGPLHIDWCAVVGRWLGRTLSDDYMVVPDSTLRLSDDTAPEPDWYIFSASVETAHVRGPDILLAVELSDSSLLRDLNPKAQLHAAFGVREYWVIDIRARRTTVHRRPGSTGYESKQTFEAGEAVDALLLPGLSLRIADLPRVGG